MIPQAGSAYAYAYATLGELVAWIIGWDLILEYAVGNVAVAISWGDYFATLLRGIGLELPAWLTTGYRTALLSSNPDVQRPARARRRSCCGLPILVNLPAFAIVMLITWLLLRGARESSTANNVMVVVKLVALALFIGVGLMALDPGNYTPFAPNGFTGIHQGAAIVFFAYIGFDAISTAGEETREPAAQPADRHPRRSGRVHGHLHGRRAPCSPAWCPTPAGGGRSAVPGARAGGLQRRRAGWWRWAPRCRCRRCSWCSSTASRASSSRWRATACCPPGRRGSIPKTRVP